MGPSIAERPRVNELRERKLPAKERTRVIRLATPEALQALALQKARDHLGNAAGQLRWALLKAKPDERAGLEKALAQVEAVEKAGALGKACGVSWSQTRYWRSAARAAAPLTAAPQVLSVVDRQAASAPSGALAGDLNLRVGAWRISVQRVTD